MFSLAKLALHHQPLDEPLKDLRWTCHEPSIPFGLVLQVQSGFLRITNVEEVLIHRRLSSPNQTVLKGAFGDALLLRISILDENIGLRLKIQFLANSFKDGTEARVHFVKMLERLEMIDKSSETPMVPSAPPVTQTAKSRITIQNQTAETQSSELLFEDPSQATSSSQMPRSRSFESVPTCLPQKPLNVIQQASQSQQLCQSVQKKGSGNSKKSKSIKQNSCCQSSQKDLFSSQCSQLQTGFSTRMNCKSLGNNHILNSCNSSQMQGLNSNAPLPLQFPMHNEKTITDLKRINSIRGSLQELKDGLSATGAAKQILMEQQKRKILQDDLNSQQSHSLLQEQMSLLSNKPAQSNFYDIQHQFPSNDVQSQPRYFVSNVSSQNPIQNLQFVQQQPLLQKQQQPPQLDQQLLSQNQRLHQLLPVNQQLSNQQMPSLLSLPQQSCISKKQQLIPVNQPQSLLPDLSQSLHNINQQPPLVNQHQLQVSQSQLRQIHSPLHQVAPTLDQNPHIGLSHQIQTQHQIQQTEQSLDPPNLSASLKQSSYSVMPPPPHHQQVPQHSSVSQGLPLINNSLQTSCKNLQQGDDLRAGSVNNKRQYENLEVSSTPNDQVPSTLGTPNLNKESQREIHYDNSTFQITQDAVQNQLQPLNSRNDASDELLPLNLTKHRPSNELGDSEKPAQTAVLPGPVEAKGEHSPDFVSVGTTVSLSKVSNRSVDAVLISKKSCREQISAIQARLGEKGSPIPSKTSKLSTKSASRETQSEGDHSQPPLAAETPRKSPLIRRSTFPMHSPAIKRLSTKRIAAEEDRNVNWSVEPLGSNFEDRPIIDFGNHGQFSLRNSLHERSLLRKSQILSQQNVLSPVTMKSTSAVLTKVRQVPGSSRDGPMRRSLSADHSSRGDGDSPRSLRYKRRLSLSGVSEKDTNRQEKQPASSTPPSSTRPTIKVKRTPSVLSPSLRRESIKSLMRKPIINHSHFEAVTSSDIYYSVNSERKLNPPLKSQSKTPSSTQSAETPVLFSDEDEDEIGNLLTDNEVEDDLDEEHDDVRNLSVQVNLSLEVASPTRSVLAMAAVFPDDGCIAGMESEVGSSARDSRYENNALPLEDRADHPTGDVIKDATEQVSEDFGDVEILKDFQGGYRNNVDSAEALKPASSRFHFFPRFNFEE